MTSRLLASGIALFAAAGFGISQQASHPQSSSAVHAVPISQEHHHHLVLENGYVRAYEVAVPAHEATLMHRHDQDYVYVVFGASDITNTAEGKDPVKMHFADGVVNFARGPLDHVSENNRDSTFYTIAIVFLHPQGEEHTYFPSVDAALDGNAQQEGSHRDPNGAKEAVVLETDECRVTAVSILENSLWEPSNTDHDRLLVKLDQFADTTGPREPNAPMYPAGMLRWMPAHTPFTLKNQDVGEMKLLVLEFKDSK